MSEEDLSYKVRVDLGSAEKDLDNFVTKISQIEAQSRGADKALDGMERSAVGLNTQLKQLSSNMASGVTRGFAVALQRAERQAIDLEQQMQRVARSGDPSGMFGGMAQELQAVRGQIRGAIDSFQALEIAQKQSSRAARDATRATLEAEKAALKKQSEQADAFNKVISDRAAIERRLAKSQSPDQQEEARRQAAIEAQSVNSARQAARDRKVIRDRELADLKAAIQERARLAQEQARIDALNSRASLRSASVLRVMGNPGGASSGYNLGGFFAGGQRAAQYMEAQNKKVQASFEGISNARYALYDVAQTLGIISAATLAASGAAIKLEADYESLLVQVKRTAQASGDEWTQLRTDLIDLTTAMPATIDDVTKIATMAGQLGISSENIDSFTESVIKFSATTNVDSATAAETLGRVAQLAGVAASDYDRMAASIYQVGVTSVSTESAILSVAEQISVSANAAGFAAEETIALASALASLGVAPERARGSIQRIFNVIENGVADGSDDLQLFARYSNMTAKEFADTWSADPQAAFVAFIDGLGRAEAAGGNINNILSELGINAVRDIDALKRLAQNVDVYTDAIYEANEGWNDGSVFAEGYAEVADTVNARVQQLVSTLKAVVEAAQDNAALKEFLGVLQILAEQMLVLARNPVVPVIAGILLGVMALVGGIALLVSGVAVAYASMLAMLTALQFMNKELGSGVGLVRMFQIAIVQMTGSMQGATLAQIEATLANQGFTNSLRQSGVAAKAAGIGVSALKGGLIGLAVDMVAIAGFSLWQKHQEDLAEFQAKVDSFSNAIESDTAEWRKLGEPVEGFEVFRRDMEETDNTSEELAATIRATADEFAGLTPEALDVAAAIDEVAIAIGGVTEAAARQSLADALLSVSQGQRQGVGDPLEYQQEQINQSIAAVLKLGYTTDQMVRALQTGDITFFEQLASEAKIAKTEASKLGDTTSYLQYSALVPLAVALQDTASANYEAMKASLVTGVAMEAAGVQTAAATEEYEAQTDAVASLADGLFDLVSAEAAMIASASDLGASLQENGTDFTTFTEGGRANIAALTQAISNAADYAGQDTALFSSLVAQIVSQLEAAGATGVRSVEGVSAALAKGPTTALSNVIAMSLLSGQIAGGFDKAASSAKGLGTKTGRAAKEVKTLSDYVSDLRRLFSEAFDFRFGFDIAQDDTAAAFRNLADAIQEAEDKSRSLNATLLGLAAEKSTLEEFLRVATDYGDTLRAQEIQADLAKNADETAEATAELAKQQAYLARDLEGGTEASEDQRKMVLDLLEAYQDQLSAYADTGASQANIARYSDVLRQKFQEQLIALGYNTAQIAKYTQSFDDLSRIINQLPRNLTLTANLDPAQRALDEFFAKNQDRSITTTLETQGGTLSDTQKKSLYAEFIKNFAPGISASASAAAWNTYLANARSRFEQLYGFRAGWKSGGYTGTGNPSDVAGDVHFKEFVFDEQSTRFYGPAYLQKMMQAARTGRSNAPASMVNVSTGTSGGRQVVDLSATSIQHLAAAMMPLLQLDSGVIAGAVSNVGARGTRGGNN